jgi:hypothetical protein
VGVPGACSQPRSHRSGGGHQAPRPTSHPVRTHIGNAVTLLTFSDTAGRPAHGVRRVNASAGPPRGASRSVRPTPSSGVSYVHVAHVDHGSVRKLLAGVLQDHAGRPAPDPSTVSTTLRARSRMVARGTAGPTAGRALSQPHTARGMTPGWHGCQDWAQGRTQAAPAARWARQPGPGTPTEARRPLRPTLPPSGPPR